jgi:hypothetical protein
MALSVEDMVVLNAVEAPNGEEEVLNGNETYVVVVGGVA